jgi:ornithine cyclodeaminase
VADLSVLTAGDIRQLVGFGPAELEAVEAVYPLISDGSAVMPPIMRIDVAAANGEIDIKSAYLPGYPGIAIKVSAGFFDNPSRGLPSLGGCMMVLDAETGIPAAALFDGGYLTDLRTGLAGAVAARHLAAPGSASVAVIGAGVQARYQIEALTLVMDIDTVSVWARRADQAMGLVNDTAGRLDLDISVAASVVEAVAGADIVVTATPATEPVIEAAWLQPGQHVTAVGADAEHKRELGRGLLDRADVIVVDSRAQSRRLGEARGALAEGLDPARLVELGEVVSGSRPGRTSVEQITVCDLTGTGAQDTAIAGLTVERARRAGVGHVIAT